MSHWPEWLLACMFIAAGPLTLIHAPGGLAARFALLPVACVCVFLIWAGIISAVAWLHRPRDQH